MAAALLSGCFSVPPSQDAGPDEAGDVTVAESTSPPVLPNSLREPASLSGFSTTKGDIHFGNLSSRIDTLTVLSQGSGQIGHQVLLINALLEHYRITSNLDSLVKAEQLTDSILEQHPDHTDALLAKAGIQAIVHQFKDAAHTLERAEELGVPAADLLLSRAEIDLATGNEQKAIERIEQRQPGDYLTYAFRGNRASDHGDLVGAQFLLNAAENSYSDTHPLPMAWLSVQRGIVFLRAGQPARALPFFQAAVDRLPAYTLAEEHLAEALAATGQSEKAMEHYERVIQRSNAPEFIGASAELLGQMPGQADLAEERHRAADALYRQRLELYPEAYWQHAADYYLERGETQRALTLAQANADMRPDAGSLLALAEILNAAGMSNEACDNLTRVQQTGRMIPELRSDEFRHYCTGR